MSAAFSASVGLMGVLALSVLTGCGSTGGTVSTDGSTSMEKVIGALKETFESENKSISVSYNPTGSGSGITAVAEGRCDIGLSSRDLKDEEIAQGLVVLCAGDGFKAISGAAAGLSANEHDLGAAQLCTGDKKRRNPQPFGAEVLRLHHFCLPRW